MTRGHCLAAAPHLVVPSGRVPRPWRVQRRVQVLLCPHLCLHGALAGSCGHLPEGLLPDALLNAGARVAEQVNLLHHQFSHIPVGPSQRHDCAIFAWVPHTCPVPADRREAPGGARVKILRGQHPSPAQTGPWHVDRCKRHACWLRCVAGWSRFDGTRHAGCALCCLERTKSLLHAVLLAPSSRQAVL